MKKEFTMTGINGTFKGSVDILFNYRNESISVHNRSTHDEQIEIIRYHKVIGRVEKEQFQSVDFRNENLVWQFIDEIEKKVTAKLHQLANVPKILSLAEQLINKGYY